VTSSTVAASRLKLPVPQEKRQLRSDSRFLVGVFGLLLFGPLAFGAVEPWSIFLLEAGAAILMVF